jgi:hypothetical protein
MKNRCSFLFAFFNGNGRRSGTHWVYFFQSYELKINNLRWLTYSISSLRRYTWREKLNEKIFIGFT